MKSFKQSIEILNTILSYELVTTSQYIVHAGIYRNSGYKNLHNVTRKRAIKGMKHAEQLIDRILFLEGTPDEETTNKINIGQTLEEQLTNDYHMEKSVISICNLCISFSLRRGDFETAELLLNILLENERHLAWLDSQLNNLKQLHLDNLLMVG